MTTLTDDETKFPMRQARLRNMIRKSELRMQMKFRRPAEFLSRRVEVRCCRKHVGDNNMVGTEGGVVEHIRVGSGMDLQGNNHGHLP